MKQTTEENIINAIAGECQARVKYQFFAEKAKQEGFSNVARLFIAVSNAEQIHAIHHYRLLSHLNGGFTTIAKGIFGPGNTSKNLGLCIMGESYEITEMYPSFKAIADLQNEKAAYTSFDWAYKSEKVHRELFKKAKDAVDAGKDVDFGPIQICQVCGFTQEGDPPDRWKGYPSRCG